MLNYQRVHYDSSLRLTSASPRNEVTWRPDGKQSAFRYLISLGYKLGIAEAGDIEDIEDISDQDPKKLISIDFLLGKQERTWLKLTDRYPGGLAQAEPWPQELRSKLQKPGRPGRISYMIQYNFM